MKEGYWITRTYEAGAIGEKTKFFIPGVRPTGKVRRRDRDAIRKAEQNEYSAVKSMARLVHANFTCDDYLLGLDYSDAGLHKVLARARGKGMPVDHEEEAIAMDAIFEAAAHELDNALRRVKRILDKQGTALKAIYLTSNMDGATGECVRVHHHLVVNHEAKDAFVQAWEKYGLGSVDWENLWGNQEDKTEMVAYLLRQVRRIPDAKKYRSTRNLLRPQPKDRIAMTEAELRVPAGCHLVYRQEFKPQRPQYIRYVIPEERRKRPQGYLKWESKKRKAEA